MTIAATSASLRGVATPAAKPPGTCAASLRNDARTPGSRSIGGKVAGGARRARMRWDTTAHLNPSVHLRWVARAREHPGLMIIDVFCHFFPARFLAERNRRAGPSFDTQYAKYYRANRGLTDLDVRFRILDRFPDVRQLLTIAGPNIESITEGRDTVELARMANDGLAELATRHPDRFTSAGACLPMNDVDAALREAGRAILDLGSRRFSAASPGSRLS
jgi:hypothetical protein